MSSFEVGSSSLGRICSSLEVVSSSLEVVSVSLGGIRSFFKDVSSSTYHCSSGNHYGLVVKPVFEKNHHTYKMA